MKSSKIPSMRYCVLQGGYWFSFSVTYCFVSVFLLANGFSNSQIGYIIAIAGLVSAIIQPILGGSIDENGRLTMRRVIMLLASTIILFGIFLTFLSETTVLLGLFYCLIIISMQTINPFVNALGMECINRGIPINFGVGRGTGSITYAIASVIMGKLVVRFSVGIIPWSIVICFALVLASVITFTYKSLHRYQTNNENQNEEDLQCSMQNTNASFLKKYPRFIFIFCGVVFVFITHNLVSTYLFQICQSVGAGAEELGLANGICATVELPTMVMFAYLIKRFKSATLLKVSGFFFGLRALLHLFAASAMGIYFAQLPQMLGFALFIPASTYYANEIMQPRDRAKGQTYLTCANSIGNLAGSALGGILLDYFGIPTMLIVGIVASVAGTLFFFTGTKTKKTA